MVKLFDVQPAGDQVPLYKLVQDEFLKAHRGTSSQFLYNLDYYLAFLPEVRYSMAERARRYVLALAQKADWASKKVDVHDLLDGCDDTYLALFAALSDYVVIGIDMEKEGYPSALYTRSEPILAWLHAQGCLSPDTNLDRITNLLYGSRTASGLNDKTFAVVRLDVAEVVNDKPIFKVVVPQKNLHIGLEKQYVAIPVPFMYLVESIIFRLFQGKPFRFVKSSVIGQVEHLAAVTPDVVREVYKAVDQNILNTRLSTISVGYNVLRQRFYAYDLESGLTSSGVASFRPEMLDVLVPVSYNDIDTSYHNIDFNLLRGIFRTRINNARTEQLESLNYLDLSGYANLRDKQAAIIEAADNAPDKEVYWLMRNNPQVFGDLEEALKKRERVAPKFLKNFEPVDLPEDPNVRVTLLNDLLKTGVVKFIAKKKDGGVFERYGTLNPKILERSLGKDYVRRFESIRSRLYYVLDLMAQGEVKSVQDLERLAVEYNFLDRVDHQVYFDPCILQGDTSKAEQAIRDVIEELKQKAASRKEDPHAVMYKNIYAEDTKGYYGNFNVNAILAVEYSKMQ